MVNHENCAMEVEQVKLRKLNRNRSLPKNGSDKIKVISASRKLLPAGGREKRSAKVGPSAQKKQLISAADRILEEGGKNRKNSAAQLSPRKAN